MTEHHGDGDGATARALVRIRDLILQRQLFPGEQVRQEDVANRIGMSRGPIREALHMLAAEGMLKYVRNRGYFVSQFTKSEMQQLYRIRDLLESEVLSKLPEPSVEHLRELRAVNDSLRAGGLPLEEATALNTKFHALLMSTSEQQLIVGAAEQVGRRSLAYQAMSINVVANPSILADDHDVMIGALESQDLALLVSFAREHREKSLHQVLPLLRDV